MYDVEVVDWSAHQATGLIDVTVRAVSAEAGGVTHGPIRKYVIDATQLKSQYNSDIAQWLQYVKREHQAHHGLHQIALGDLAAMKGKKI
jgi:hypothetical protein